MCLKGNNISRLYKQKKKNRKKTLILNQESYVIQPDSNRASKFDHNFLFPQKNQYKKKHTINQLLNKGFPNRQLRYVYFWFYNMSDVFYVN